MLTMAICLIAIRNPGAPPLDHPLMAARKATVAQTKVRSMLEAANTSSCSRRIGRRRVPTAPTSWNGAVTPTSIVLDPHRVLITNTTVPGRLADVGIQLPSERSCAQLRDLDLSCHHAPARPRPELR